MGQKSFGPMVSLSSFGDFGLKEILEFFVIKKTNGNFLGFGYTFCFYLVFYLFSFFFFFFFVIVV